MKILLDYEPLKDTLFNTTALDSFLAIKAEIKRRLQPIEHQVLILGTMIIVTITPSETPIKIDVLENDQSFKLKILEHLNGFDFEKILTSKIKRLLN